MSICFACLFHDIMITIEIEKRYRKPCACVCWDLARLEASNRPLHGWKWRMQHELAKRFILRDDRGCLRPNCMLCEQSVLATALHAPGPGDTWRLSGEPYALWTITSSKA